MKLKAGGCKKNKTTYLGKTAYLLNHVAHTSAASSLKPISLALDGVGWVSIVQLDPVTEADAMNGEKLAFAYSELSWRFDCGKSWTSNGKDRL